MNLEDCSGCGLQGWGWQDNGWGVGVMGPLIKFESTGRHVIRVITREDGFNIDQIVLSSSRYVSSSPRGVEGRHDDPHEDSVIAAAVAANCVVHRRAIFAPGSNRR